MESELLSLILFFFLPFVAVLRRMLHVREPFATLNPLENRLYYSAAPTQSSHLSNDGLRVP